MKLASYVGTRDSIMGLGNRLIRLRLSGIRQSLQTDNTSIQDTLRASHSEIVFEPGDSQVGEMQDGKQVMGTLIRNCGPYYEVYHLKDLGNKVQRTRFGYKIGNAMGNDPELTRAMVVGIGFSYKRKKK